jgi:hypothetical protein
MRIHFFDVAKQAFSFLERTGFSLTQGGPSQLQYETTQVFVTIGWDARSGELNVFVGFQPRKAEARNAFSMTDLLALEGVDIPE